MVNIGFYIKTFCSSPFNLGRPIFPISGSDIYDKFVGNSEKNANQVSFVFCLNILFIFLLQLFEEIAQNAPSILFIDEADQLLSSRDVSKNDDTATRDHTYIT